MASDDPWHDIGAAHASQIAARRVTQATPWGLYWGVDAERNVLLILQHSGTSRRSRRLPRLRGLRVEAQPANGGADERIVIRLTDPEQRDIFLRFCRDIVDATVLAQTEEQAVERFLARTWRGTGCSRAAATRDSVMTSSGDYSANWLCWRGTCFPRLTRWMRSGAGPARWIRLTTSRFPGYTSRRRRGVPQHPAS